MYYHTYFSLYFHRYFNGKSITDGGTLWYLRCLIKRHNISKNVSKEMNELEDFFHSVAHVTAAALHYFVGGGWGAGDRLHTCRLNTKCHLYSVLFFC